MKVFMAMPLVVKVLRGAGDVVLALVVGGLQPRVIYGDGMVAERLLQAGGCCMAASELRG